MVNEAIKENYKTIYNGRVGFGRSPALLIVDFINAYVTPGWPPPGAFRPAE